jgi:hypothetical protein
MMSGSSRFDLTIGAPPDRTGLVAELWFDGQMWGELRYEGADFLLELYPAHEGATWLFDAQEAMDLIARAKARLQELDENA